jgi:serine/threonine protein phosphatase PrpC
MVTITAGAVTHPGLVRSANEDSLVTTGQFAAVADGMGGHAAGEVASRIAVETIAELAAQPAPQPDDVVAAIARANGRILEQGATGRELAGMGTTLSGVGLVNVTGTPQWIVFNVGDSRVYRYADGTLAQVTVDHSEVAELLAAGQLSADEARDYPRRNVVTRSLGSHPPPQPDVWVFPPRPGERFLVCSDGLTLEMSDAEIAAVLDKYPDPNTAARELMEHALAAGGRDNVTVIVVVAR